MFTLSEEAMSHSHLRLFLIKSPETDVTYQEKR